MRLLVICFGLALGCGVPACGLGPPSTPAETLARYVQALEGDDPQAAYRLLDEPTRAQLPYETFAQRWRDSGVERRAQAAALRRAPQPSLAAHVTLDDGVQLSLERETRRGGWLLSEVRTDGAKPQAPEEALRLLLHAAEQRNFAALLRLLTPAQRQLVENELQERIDCLRAALSRRQAVEIKGDRARIQYDPRFFIELKKEPDGWRVLDLN